MASGQDPKRQREEAKEARDLARQAEAVTFGMLAGEWLADCLPRWGEGHAQRQRGILNNYLFPSLGKRPITAIDEREMALALSKIGKRVSHDWAAPVSLPDMCLPMRSRTGICARPTISCGTGTRTSADCTGRNRRRAGIFVPAALQILPMLAQRPGQLVQMR